MKRGGVQEKGMSGPPDPPLDTPIYTHAHITSTIFSAIFHVYLFSALPILIGLHLWGIMIGTEEVYSSFRLGWGFFLAVAHCNLTLIGGSVAFIGATKRKPQQPLIIQDEIADVKNSCTNAIMNIA